MSRSPSALDRAGSRARRRQGARGVLGALGRGAGWRDAVVLGALVLGATVSACSRGDDGAPSQVPPSWAEARLSPGHKAHLGKRLEERGEQRTVVCADCHGKGSVDFAVKVAPCAKCHDAEQKLHHEGSKDAPTGCTSCHAFKGPAGASAPTCVDCHRGGGLAGKLAHRHHRTSAATCTSCHAPHGLPKVVLATCTTCHVGIGVRHGNRVVPQADADAGVDAIAEQPWDAGPAHREASTAAAPFLVDGGPSGDDAAELERLAQTPAGVCAGCHLPHATGKDATDSCQNCHDKDADGPSGLAWLARQAPKIQPQGPGVAGHKGCTACHAPHQAYREAVRPCVGCHGAKKSVSLVKGHADCKSCHTPHAPTDAPNRCVDCHRGHAALGTPKVAQHARCSSCHDVHTPAASAATACEKCHAAVHPNHPKALAKVGESACIGCHAPHPASSNAIVKPCTSCHQAIAKADAKVHGTATCGTCHAKHEGFKLTGQGSGFCVSCHGKQAQSVGPGHADCKGCHGGAHGPVRPVVCRTCHEAEASTAPKGHASCPSCHEPHGGRLVVGDGKPGRALCVACHAGKAQAVHGASAPGCASCHRPHGPKGPAATPTCTSCHAVTSLPGLHEAKPHQANCLPCHGGHSKPASDRATCTGKCHSDRKAHQADAKDCRGCHNFKL
jgi:predicted CXXCH cytochrome family protein